MNFVVGKTGEPRKNLLRSVVCSPLFRYHHRQSVLPKGRSFAVNSGIKAAVLLKSRSFTANSGTKVAVLLGMNRCGIIPFSFRTQLSLVFEQILKDLRGTSVEVRKVDFANFVLRTSSKFTTGVKYQLHQCF